jgi:hypothetical protein
VLAAVAVVFGAVAAPSNALAGDRARGGVSIHDEPDCVALRTNDAKVAPPFSILITGLTPSSTTSQLYVTDKDAQPDIIYGPYTIPEVDGAGRACLNVLNAPPGVWKIDVVEDGSGFTDSKVFTVEGPTPTTTIGTTTTTTGSTTTTTGSTTTTTGSTTTTTGSTTTTTGSTTTTTRSTTTTTPGGTTTTSEPPPERRPWEELPWVLGLSRSAATPATLPPTGSDVGTALLVIATLSVTGLALVGDSRRRSRA